MRGKRTNKERGKTWVQQTRKGGEEAAGGAGEERGRSGEGRARRRPELSARGAPDRRGGGRWSGPRSGGSARGGGRREGVCRAAARDVAPAGRYQRRGRGEGHWA